MRQSGLSRNYGIVQLPSLNTGTNMLCWAFLPLVVSEFVCFERIFTCSFSRSIGTYSVTRFVVLGRLDLT